jgi:aryl-alcohol dehydrogenase-like predicted oxidoreductase
MTSKLPTRRVGETEVSAIGYGAMGISSYYGAAPPDEERFKVLPILLANINHRAAPS